MPALDRFADEVKDMASLAEPVRIATEKELLPGEGVPQIIYAPPHEGAAGRRWVGGWLSWRPSPAWVLVLTDTRLLLATIDAGEPAPTVSAAPIANMLRIELGEILLYAWFEWSWAVEGELRQERVYFNSVRADLFTRMLETIRADILAQFGPPLAGQERDLASFKHLPYKFANIIPHFLLVRGERAEAVVFQPAIWGRHLGLLPYKRAPVTVAVLTPQTLLFVQDDLSHQKAAYGVIASYCPRNRVAALELDRKENEVVLNVTLRWQEAEEKLCYLFEAEAEPGLRELIAKLEGSPNAAKMTSSGDGKGSSNGRTKGDGTAGDAEIERSDLGRTG